MKMTMTTRFMVVMRMPNTVLEFALAPNTVLEFEQVRMWR